MASLRSSQGLSLLLVALLVCQAFTVPTVATAPWIPKGDLTTPRAPKAPQVMVTIQGNGGENGHAHVDDNSHGHGGHNVNGHGHGGHDDNGHGHGGHDDNGRGHGGHGHGDHDEGRHD